MVKRFKAKKRFRLPKIIIYILIIVLFYLFYKWILSLSIDRVNNSFLQFLTNYYHHYSYDEEKVEIPLVSVYKYYQETINNPNQILIQDLVYNKQPNMEKLVKNDNKALVYIYNTHQKESYNMTYVEDYNVVPDVLLMSHIMQEKLNNIGINTMVEEHDISSYLGNNHLKYSQSYQASRFYLTDVLENNPNLKLIIDLHRDAANYEDTTIEFDGKKYAKVMFVIGKENSNYMNNLNVANTLNDKIKSFNEFISRGILEKSGKGVNGVYNQDLKDNIILLELGGDKNNIDELINTIDIIVPIIKEYIDEKN